MPSRPLRGKSYNQILKGYRKGRENIINLGAPPPKGAKDAWKYLSREAKAKLEEARNAGMFGGIPGAAPYWLVQERGKEIVGVAGTHYLQRAIKTWQEKYHIEIKQWLGYGRGRRPTL